MTGDGFKVLLFGLVLASFLLACNGDDGKAGKPGRLVASDAPKARIAIGNDSPLAISLSLVGSTTAVADNFDESAAEILAYHPESRIVYVVNSAEKSVARVGLSDPSSPGMLSSQIDVATDVPSLLGAAGTLRGVFERQQSRCLWRLHGGSDRG